VPKARNIREESPIIEIFQAEIAEIA